MDDDQDILTDYLLDELEEDSPLNDEAVLSSKNFLEEYQNFQRIVSSVDKIDLDVIDSQTGKKTHFKQVRFSSGNVGKH